MRQISNESDVWKFLNRTRKKREKIEGNVEKEEWKNHFVTLLEGSQDSKLGKSREHLAEVEEGEKEKITGKLEKHGAC